MKNKSKLGHVQNNAKQQEATKKHEQKTEHKKETHAAKSKDACKECVYDQSHKSSDNKRNY